MGAVPKVKIDVNSEGKGVTVSGICDEFIVDMSDFIKCITTEEIDLFNLYFGIDTLFEQLGICYSIKSNSWDIENNIGYLLLVITNDITTVDNILLMMFENDELRIYFFYDSSETKTHYYTVSGQSPNPRLRFSKKKKVPEEKKDNTVNMIKNEIKKIMLKYSNRSEAHAGHNK